VTIYIKCIAGVITHTSWSDYGYALNFPLFVNAKVINLKVKLPLPIPINCFCVMENK
jgi:hypothetical protein